MLHFGSPLSPFMMTQILEPTHLSMSSKGSSCVAISFISVLKAVWKGCSCRLWLAVVQMQNDIGATCFRVVRRFEVSMTIKSKRFGISEATIDFCAFCLIYCIALHSHNLHRVPVTGHSRFTLLRAVSRTWLHCYGGECSLQVESLDPMLDCYTVRHRT